jgi:hypothetical protein
MSERRDGLLSAHIVHDLVARIAMCPGVVESTCGFESDAFREQSVNTEVFALHGYQTRDVITVHAVQPHQV